MEKNQMILDSIPEGFRQKKLGAGTEGTAYLTSEGKVFKEHYNPIFYKPIMELLTTKISENVAFPEKTIYLHSANPSNFVGTMMPYIEGYAFRDLDQNFLFDEIINSIIDLEKEVLRISKDGIVFCDVDSNDILVTPEKKLVIVDTDWFTIDTDSLDYPVKQSLKELSWTIIEYFINDCNFENERFNEMYYKCCVQGKFKPSRLLIEIRDYLEKVTKENVNTVNDFSTNLPLILKK